MTNHVAIQHLDINAEQEMENNVTVKWTKQ